MGVDLALYANKTKRIHLGRRHNLESEQFEGSIFNKDISKKEALDYVNFLMSEYKSIPKSELEEEDLDIQFVINYLESIITFIKSNPEDSNFRFSDDFDDFELEGVEDLDLQEFQPKYKKLYTFVDDCTPSFKLFSTPQEAVAHFIEDNWVDGESLEINGCIDEYILIEK